MVFANISRTVRARSKILAEINPLGHKHTPAHLFPAKNVIISQFCHGSQIWSFLMKKDSKHVGFCHKKIDQIYFDYFICFVKYLSHIGCKHLCTANLYFWLVFHTGCSKNSKYAEFAAPWSDLVRQGIMFSKITPRGQEICTISTIQMYDY